MNRTFVCLALTLMVILTIWGCSNDTSNKIDGPVGNAGTCLGCHASEDALKAALPPASGSLVAYVAKGGG